MKVIAIIASRYGSTRFPAKALADICGRPMVWWVYQQAKNAKNIDEIYVACDHNKIIEVCNKYDIPTIMTKTTHREAANRLQEVSEKISADFYIQINGDEPLICPNLITLAIPKKIIQNREFGTNIISKIQNPTELMDKTNIKVVFDKNMYATYMSRQPIPCPYKTNEVEYYKHIGIIGYNKKMLDFYANNPPGQFELIEGIATLRFTDYSKRLLCIIAQDTTSLSVDTEDDIIRVREIMKKRIKEQNIKF